jgi:hypothetical protein
VVYNLPAALLKKTKPKPRNNLKVKGVASKIVKRVGEKGPIVAQGE